MKSITLHIGGQERIFYFGLGFLGNFLEKSGIEMSEIDNKIKENPFKWIPEIMYYSAIFGFTRKNEFADFDAFDVAEWIDEVGIDSPIISQFFTAFQQSLVKNVPEEKEVKKKVTKK